MRNGSRSTRLVTLVGHLFVVVGTSVLMVVVHRFSGGTVAVPSRRRGAHSKSEENETDNHEPLHVIAPGVEGGVPVINTLPGFTCWPQTMKQTET